MTQAEATETTLCTGRTHWRCKTAERAAVLADGEAYFAAFRAASLLAQRVIRIVGWDIHSRMRLIAGMPGDRFPAELGPFLNALLRRRHQLRIDVLICDFAAMAIVLLFAALVAVWRYTPLAHFVTLPKLVAEVRQLGDRPWLPVYVLDEAKAERLR